MTVSIPPNWNVSTGTYGWYTPDTGFLPLKTVFEVALVGQEEHYTIGLFLMRWDAESAAAKALLGYRRWCREHLDDILKPRGLDLHASVRSYRIDTYQLPWWESASASKVE